MKFACSENCKLSEQRISDARDNLKKTLDFLQKGADDKKYSSPYSFLAPLRDKEIFEEVVALSEEKRGKNLKIVFLAGIGGANLAAKASLNALGYDGGIRIIFFDTLSAVMPETFKKEISNIDNADEFLALIVSKSGETIETITNAQLITSLLEEKFGDISSRVVFITQKDTRLWKEGENYGASLLSVPESVSDRFSAFLPTALFPLSLLGFDIKEFIDGAENTARECVENTNSNPAIISASVLNRQYESGVKILNLFFFHPNLEDIGKWSRQLEAESLGKEEKNSGQKIANGFTPTVSVGTTDLHSMLQLYLAGPKETFTQFVFVNENNKTALHNSKILGKLDDNFVGKTPDEISRVIFESVKKSYTDKNLPFAEITFEKLKEREIGAYMAFKMVETVMLGALWNIDVFNQPNVEEYKERARKILEK